MARTVVDPFFTNPATEFLRLPVGCVALGSYTVSGQFTWRETAYFRRIDDRDELWIRHRREPRVETRLAIQSTARGEEEHACRRLFLRLHLLRWSHNRPILKGYRSGFYGRADFEQLLTEVGQNSSIPTGLKATECHRVLSHGDRVEVDALLVESGFPINAPVVHLIHTVAKRYARRIPADLLDRVTRALIPAPGKAPFQDVLVCGNDQFSDSLVLLPASCLEIMAREQIAIETARTWGELYNKLGTSGAGYVQDCISSHCDYPDFETFCAARLEEEPGQSRRTLRRDYLDRTYGSRPPLPSEPFDQDDWYQIAFDFDLSSPDARTVALTVLPLPLMRQFGKVEGGSPLAGGDFLFLPHDKREEIAVAAESLGYIVIDDQVMVNAGCGDALAAEVEVRCAVYAAVKEFVSSVGECLV